MIVVLLLCAYAAFLGSAAGTLLFRWEQRREDAAWREGFEHLRPEIERLTQKPWERVTVRDLVAWLRTEPGR